MFFFALSWIIRIGFELIFLSPIFFQTKIYVCTNARLSIIGLGLYFLESKGCHASHIVPYLLWIEDKLLDIEFTERQTGRFSKNILNFLFKKMKEHDTPSQVLLDIMTGTLYRLHLFCFLRPFSVVANKSHLFLELIN